MTEIKLRDYQRECIDAVFAAWGEGVRRPAVVLPTGAGKTVVFSALVREFRVRSTHDAEQFGGSVASRVIVLVHRDELADQAIAKLRAVLPEGVSVGKVKAEDNQVTADVMVCSVQTLASKERRYHLELGELDHGKIGLIITDECHHAAAASYKKVYAAFPDALQLGVTATLARGDDVGLGDTWDEVVYSRSILWMIKHGYLTDVRMKRVELSDMDMGDVKVSRGDYQAGDLGRAMMDSHADTAVARAYKEHAGDRPGIVFTPTVETAEAVRKELESAGIRTATVSGETPRDERRRAFDDFRTGKIQVLSNCMVLTEGFDAPWAQVAVIARPTRSQPLYTQMVGRVLRPWPGKKDALVLDLVGASAMKLRTLVDLEPGAVREIGEGESLAEAEEREERAANRLVGPASYGLKARDVDAFGHSDFAWTQTHKGVLFISCGDAHVIVWPSEQAGLWDVVWAAKGERWVRTAHRALDLGQAMAWGETVADDHGAFSVRKSARWRSSAATETQLNYAESLGIAGAAAMRRGELSDALSVAVGSEEIDRYVK